MYFQNLEEIQQKNFLNKAYAQRAFDVNNRMSMEDRINDIVDGDELKRILEEYPHLKTDFTSYYGLCLDGVSPYSSSKYSMWPVFLVDLTLPSKIRSIPQNLILIALWPGPSKPNNPSLLLKPLVVSLGKLFFGVEGIVNGQIENLYGVLVFATGDLDARCSFQHMVLYRGYFGCPYCTHPGEWVKHTQSRNENQDQPKKVGGAVKFPGYQTYPRRDSAETEAMLEQGCSEYQGVNRLQIFSTLPYWNIFTSWALDAMHLVFMRLSQHYFELLLSNPSSRTRVKFFLDSVMLPHDFGRPINELENWRNWKSEQYKSFLLFFAVPSLAGVVPDAAVWAIKVLVRALKLLIGPMVFKADLDVAHDLLSEHNRYFEILYGAENMRLVTHLLLEMVADVKRFGGLATHWMFPFESMFSSSLSLVTGTTHHLEPRLTEALMTVSHMEQVRKSTRVPQHLQKLCPQPSALSQTRPWGILGKPKQGFYQFDDQIFDCSFLRLELSGIIYHCDSYTKAKGSTIIQVTGGTFCRILNFYCNYNDELPADQVYMHVTLFISFPLQGLPEFLGDDNLLQVQEGDQALLPVCLIESKAAISFYQNITYIIPLC